jgi:hypothetical protein
MRWWRLVVTAGAALLALAPLPPPLVERWYANGAYPLAQSLLTRISNLVPFALFDALIVVALAVYLWRLGTDVGSRQKLGWLRIVLRASGRLVVSAAVLYLAFLVCWGLNYRREPLTGRLAFDSGAVSPTRARDLGLLVVDRVNALYAPAHAALPADLGSSELAAAFLEAEHELDVQHPAVPGRPKRTLLDPYFRLAAVDGMTDPYFLETLVVSDLLPFERPFVVAHEWGHLAGFADESEANFIGWLACVHGRDAEQYSGWLFLYGEIAGGLRRTDFMQVSAHLAEGPRADLRAVAARIRRHVNETVSNAGWRVYDDYLKANHVEAGAASYAEVVRTILGTEFDADWKPKLRD